MEKFNFGDINERSDSRDRVPLAEDVIVRVYDEVMARNYEEAAEWNHVDDGTKCINDDASRDDVLAFMNETFVKIWWTEAKRDYLSAAVKSWRNSSEFDSPEDEIGRAFVEDKNILAEAENTIKIIFIGNYEVNTEEYDALESIRAQAEIK